MVDPESYEALAVANAVTMLCNCATFRALVGAADADAALAYVINTWGGDPKRQRDDQALATFSDGNERAVAAPYAVVDLFDGDLDVQEGGVSSDDYFFTIEILLYLPRLLTGENGPAAVCRARNSQGLVRSELRAQFGAAGCLASGTASATGLTIPEPSSADAALIAGITLACYA